MKITKRNTKTTLTKKTAKKKLQKPSLLKNRWLWLVVGVIVFAALASSILKYSDAATTPILSKEAETFNLSLGSILTDATASGSQMVNFTSAGNATAAVMLSSSASNFGIRLKGVQCKGSPSVQVSIDSVNVPAQSVGSTSWTEYSFAKTVSAGSHVFSVSFTNPQKKGSCTRSLSFDSVTFYATTDTGTGGVGGTVPGTSQFVAAYNVASNSVAGWIYEKSGALEQVNIANGRAECMAGGYAADTHYARVRRKLPENDDFAAKKSFTIKADLELPADFYDRHESYIRFITTDNFPGLYKSTGAQVGAASADEWRVGFLVYGGDSLPRLMSEHENHEALELWRGSQRLTTGRHTLVINFNPSQGTTGSWDVTIDGVRMGGQSNIKTVPATMTPAEIAVTRVGGCIDGAANQDTKVQNVYLYSLDFAATK